MAETRALELAQCLSFLIYTPAELHGGLGSLLPVCRRQGATWPQNMWVSAPCEHLQSALLPLTLRGLRNWAATGWDWVCLPLSPLPKSSGDSNQSEMPTLPVTSLPWLPPCFRTACRSVPEEAWSAAPSSAAAAFCPLISANPARAAFSSACCLPLGLACYLSPGRLAASLRSASRAAQTAPFMSIILVLIQCSSLRGRGHAVGTRYLSLLAGSAGDQRGPGGASSHFTSGRTEVRGTWALLLCQAPRTLQDQPPALPWACLSLTGLFPSPQLQPSRWDSGCFCPAFRQTLKSSRPLSAQPPFAGHLSFGALLSAPSDYSGPGIGGSHTVSKGLLSTLVFIWWCDSGSFCNLRSVFSACVQL